MKIAIYGNRHQENFIRRIASFLNHLHERGDSVTIHAKLYNYLIENDADMLSLLADAVVDNGGHGVDADLAVSIGGDGTFLRTTQWLAGEEIPIIGVNTGHLGFLAPFTLEEAAAQVDMFASGESSVEARTVLCIETADGSDIGTWPYALNELVIQKRDTASMVTVAARIDRLPLADYLCDGLIISTPTGSTAYNLSAGGPIVAPEAPNFIVSPIAAHTLTMRPLVISSESLLELRTTSRAHSFNIAVDGRTASLPCGTSLFVSKAPFSVLTVRKPGHNFYSGLREKLLWGETMSGKK